MQVLGLDIGTTSICGICCDAHSGKILEVVTVSNDATVPGQHAWEKMQDPKLLIQKVKEIAETLLQKWTNVCAIGVTGQMHGIVYLDEEGETVSPLFIWQDGRGDQVYKEGKTYAQWLGECTGYALATGYGAVTHFYNVVNGLVPKTAKTFCTIHDLAAMVLANVTTPVLHPSDAASFGLYDLRFNQFDKDAILAAGMNPEFFPEVKTGYPILGKTATGIPVSVAIGDNQASVLGSVKDMEKSLLVNVGTGSQISCIVRGVPVHCEVDCRPLTEDLYLLAGSSLCGGRAYAILEKFLRETARLVTGVQVDSAYSAMDKVVEELDRTEPALVVDTSFSGTRQEPDKRGSIRNINIDNLTMAHLCDGVMNGIAGELYTLYQQMQPMLQKVPCQMVASGNGVRLNKHLTERFVKAFGLPLFIPRHKEEAAFGAALFGMVAASVKESIQAAQELIYYEAKENEVCNRN